MKYSNLTRFSVFTILVFICSSIYVGQTIAQTPQNVNLRHITFVPTKMIDKGRDLSSQLPEAPSSGERGYVWLQFDKSLTNEELARLRGADLRTQGYVRPYTYLVSIPLQISGNPLKTLPNAAIHPYEPDHKFALSLYDELTELLSARNKVDIIVQFHEDIPTELAYQDLESIGIQAKTWIEAGKTARIITGSENIYKIALLASVRHLEKTPEKGEPEDQFGRALHRSNLLDRPNAGSPLKYNGEGVNVLVRDDGKIGPHIDFQGRLNQDFAQGDELNGTHGDMVAGILAGAGNLQPFVQGMANGATIYVEDYSGDFPEQTVNLLTNQGVVVTNSSYSDGCNVGNTFRTTRVDQQIYNLDTIMHVFSAGNAGTQNCGYGAGSFWGNITGGHKAGKNSIATANLFNDYSLVNSSSRGPVWDGRIKPDISAHGQNQLSTYPNNTIDAGGGTSAAAPGIAGIMAQLYQVYKAQNNGQNPSSSLIKAAMLNAASDLGNPGPDFIYGWGHVNTWGAYEILTKNQYAPLEIAPGETKSLDIIIPSGLQEARIMIYWKDPPAMIQAPQGLVQDIDLKVYAPGEQTPYLPLVLDPTPNAANLNAPAIPGIDRINNVEQVRITQPQAGSYRVEIDGFELPSGTSTVWIVYHFITDTVLMAYPNGGESFAPGSSTQIYWEAAQDDGPWNVEISVDSGLVWSSLATNLDASERHAVITFPDVRTKNGFIRLNRNGISYSHVIPFHLMEIPRNIEVTKACPDSIYIEWNALDGEVDYHLYSLGEKYMEWRADTDTNYIAIPSVNPLAENWFALQSEEAPGSISRRSNAVVYQAGLLNCKQDVDIRLTSLVNGSNFVLFSCEPDSMIIGAFVRNEGLLPAAGIPIFYQIADQEPVEGVITQTINPNNQRIYSLKPAPYFDQSGQIPFKVWSDLPGEQFKFNDTLYTTISVFLQSSTILVPDFVETFDESDEIPADWTVVDEGEDDFSWVLFPFVLEDTDTLNALVMPNYFYDQIGQRDRFISPQIDLSKACEPMLLFDLAYGGILGTADDSLLVQISLDCGATIHKTIYAKTGPDLITSPSSWSLSDPFLPELSEDWRTESLDLSEFIGEKVQINFVNVAGFSNNTWLKNISVIDNDPGILMPGFVVDKESICQNESVFIEDTSKGGVESWSWNFGEGSFPETATGEGPHEILFSTAGTKTILLEVTKGVETLSTSRTLNVAPLPVANFTFTKLGDTLFLMNQSQFGTSYDWIIEGTSYATSADTFYITDANTPELLSISLTVRNECGVDFALQVISTSSVFPQGKDKVTVNVSPNPTSDRSLIELSGLTQACYMELIDMSGRIVWQYSLTDPGNAQSVSLEMQAFPGGSYLLRISSGKWYETRMIQKD